LDELNGADAYLRAAVLEERLGFDAAREAFEDADTKLYTPEVRAARDLALARVVEVVDSGDGAVLDVATGRGALLERLVHGARAVTASDSSPRVLELLRRRLGDSIEYVVADARSLPFPDASVPTIVSHLELASIAEGETALQEVRRVGRELVVTHFFLPKEDAENQSAAHELGLDTLLERERGLAALGAAGWRVEIEFEREVGAVPTPASELVPGVRIDALPVTETRGTWCVLRAA
jgi:ubiquinone/menaquinone biosynthesis C-methylase UbiE